ncbi:HNH endonuclease [Sphingomonas sp. URHD0057]|uniref:HNH endonuclease n=1 Tax=Sphingomonas sp. URHD0057 TaxID=1380389 RepID=UPI0006862021|nr:HNH endonuclease [Sphingomonas sp. URHD0057]
MPTVTPSTIIPMDQRDAFWAKVERGGEDECWPFIGSRTVGYGYFYWGSSFGVRAHRVAYSLTHNIELRRDDVILHRCDNPPCCNPAHLTLGTHADNVADKVAKGRARGGNSGKTHCQRGHALSPPNTYATPDGRRQCRTCAAGRQRAYKARAAA